MKLEYQVPQLGKVTIRLFDHAIETYKLLNKYGHVERMKDIDQLGVISRVYEGAHHSRWEYVMVQLGLINKLNEIGGFGLSSKIKISDETVSGAEILQMWTLLFNAGHLPGTFATARALLRCCREDSNLYHTIYYGLPQNQMRAFFKNVLTDDNIYNFHKILISFHLERYHRYKCKDFDLINCLQEIILFYISKQNPHNKKREHLKNLSRRIRQISYIFLDSHYGPVPINFNLSTIFFNFDDYSGLLFKEYDNPIIATLNSFDDFLSANIYHSGEAIRKLGSHEKRIKLIIEKKKFDKITIFQKYLMQNYHDFQPEHGKENLPLIYILFNDIHPLFNDILKKNLSFETEEKWNKKYGQNSCLLTFQSSPPSKQIAITLSFLSESKIQKNVKILGNFLKDLIELNIKLKNEKYFPAGINDYIIDEEIFKKPYHSLMQQILSYISNQDLYFEFKDYNKSERLFLSTRGAKKAARYVAEIKKSIEKKDPDKSRLHEIDTIQKSLLDLNLRSELLLSLSQILIYDKTNQHLTDIDGFGLCYKDGNLGVLIVEAKDQRHGSGSDSEKQLNETIEKLELKTSFKPKIIQIGKGAYCYLIIDGKSIK